MLQGVSLLRAKPRLAGFALPALDAPGLAAALLYLAFFVVGLLQFTDPDYWWHLRTGQIIVQTGSIPRHDPFTFTSGDRPWVATEWLSEAIIYGVQALGGYALNALLFTAVATAALAVAHRTALSLGIGKWTAIPVVAWCGLMSVPYWTVRPQAFTWLLFAIFIAVLLTHRRTGRGLWLLPPLMLLWTNLHLGYAIGLGVLGLYAGECLVERFLARKPRDVNGPLLALAACVAVTLANPNTIHLFLYPLEFLRPGNANVALITEFRSPNFHEPGHVLFALAILTLIGLGVFRARLGVFLAGLTLSFTYFALLSIRHQPLFAIVFLVAMGALLAEAPAWLKGIDRQRPGARSGLNYLLLVAAVFAATVLVGQAPHAQLGSQALTDGRLYYPAAGAQFVRSGYPDARVFNTQKWGGYLINELYPQRVFIDGRSDVLGREVFSDYLQVVDLRHGWSGILDDWDIDLVLIESDSSLAAALAESSDWALAFTGPHEAVFLRRATAAPAR